MRKTIDTDGTAKGFYTIQFLVSLITSALVARPFGGWAQINGTLLTLGGAAGLSLACMKVMLDRALRSGPAGLTFVAVNCASVFPAFLSLLFLRAFVESTVNRYDILGGGILLVGLYLSTRKRGEMLAGLHWAIYAFLASAMYMFYLMTTELRARVLQQDYFAPLLSWMDPSNLESEWFTPVTFFFGFILLTAHFLRSEQRALTKKEIQFGTIGGVLTGLSGTLFVLATDFARLGESTLIYALFTFSVVVTCNLWGQYHFREKVNWYGTALCLAGVWITKY